jgi:4-amino-4-deoxy-L-arabinose transferase-like glycosyltransferase
MLVFGTQDWSVRLFELVFSIPCLLLILLILRKLHGSGCALLSGLILVLLPYSGYFGFSPLMVLLSLWALNRYLLLIGRLGGIKGVRYFFWGGELKGSGTFSGAIFSFTARVGRVE